MAWTTCNIRPSAKFSPRFDFMSYAEKIYPARKACSWPLDSKRGNWESARNL